MDVDDRDEGAGHPADVVELGIAEIVRELFSNSFLAVPMHEQRPGTRPTCSGEAERHGGRARSRRKEQRECACRGLLRLVVRLESAGSG